MCLLCHVWNKSVSSLLCNNIKFGSSCIVFKFFKQGANEAVTPAVISELIWGEKKPGGQTGFKANENSRKFNMLQTVGPGDKFVELGWLDMCSKFRFIPSSSM